MLVIVRAGLAKCETLVEKQNLQSMIYDTFSYLTVVE